MWQASKSPLGRLRVQLHTRHPDCSILSPCMDRFYDKAHKLDAIEFFKKFTVSPDDLPDTVFASIGRTVFRDIGATALVFRMATKVRGLLCVTTGVSLDLSSWQGGVITSLIQRATTPAATNWSLSTD